MSTVFLICISTLAALSIILWLGYRLHALRRQISNKCRLGELILKKIDAYVLLIDGEFDVRMTNFYSLTETPQPQRMPKAGNLLRCKNGEDAGLCGQHALCMDCPIRNAGEKTFRERKGFSGVETPMTLYTSDAHTRTAELEVSVSGSYLEFEGKPHLLLTIHDITSQKQIQRELEDARIRVERADRTKTIFLTNTSHEFRTPINAIIGFSELLGGGICTPEESQEYVGVIRKSSNALLQMVDDLLDLAKIETGTFKIENGEVELCAFMQELEDEFRAQQPAGTPVRLLFMRTSASFISTDRKRLHQVLSHLLSNAVKFTDEGEIRFGFETRRDEIYFYVSDTGCGIPEEFVGNLFQRFAKAGSHKQGVGIGLAICKAVVTAMHGRIGVESREGHGSRFWFTLPVSVRAENELTA